ncbi:AMP-binding protein [Kitasatospora sp. NBC_01250]|uniref:AMP-binding protein n=1 Tax=Kitasatospora sp. NBC_01250 TaxID=2903571 RepID=UPI002E36DF7C|nr:AMP-binding protein [Kitasatospora sp. NBC_01250]
MAHQWVVGHAQRTPTATALRWNGVDTSYRELVEAARRSAGFLAARGLGRGDVVAVRAACVPDTVKLLLGIVWCGAAYTLVPPDWPAGRFEQIAAFPEVRLCVVEPGTPAVAGVPTITVEEALGRLAPDDPFPFTETELSGTDTLCVFFTSGSTGAPKGVLAPHRGVVRLAFDADCTVVGDLVTYQTASSAWDALCWELWTPLVSGGTCVLSGGTHPTGPRVRAAIAEGTNALFLNTVIFNALVDDDIDCLSGLDLLITGGERHSARHLTECLRHFPQLRLQQTYGPAENTTYTTMHRVHPQDGTQVPIGRPVSGTEVWLLDEEHRLVAEGATGEIVITGQGLANGYLGDPESTGRRFPTLELGGVRQRAYLTGDLARRDPQGRLIFIGRRDRQLKIRGVRIEPTEVEAVIEQVPGVSRATVLALRDDTDRAIGLAAVVSSEGGAQPSADLVTKTVAAAFPAAFVPELVLPVDRMPKLPNGKVDYRALTALLPRAPREAAAAAPESAPAGESAPTGDSAAEQSALVTALTIAAGVMGHPVSSDEDLFDGGATSMTAIRLATRLSRALDRQVTETDVLKARSIGALLAHRTDQRPATAASPAAADPVEPEYSLFALEKFWRMAEHEPDLHESIMPMLFVLRGSLDVARLRAALDAVVARHDVLRARFGPGAKGLRAEVAAPAETTGVLQVDSVPRSFDGAEREARRWLTAPFTLRDGLPIRARLLATTGGDRLLAVVGHHIAFDAWSTQVFWRDLFDAYRAIAHGRPAFEEPAASFFATYQDQLRAHAEQRPAAARTWRERVADIAPIAFPGAREVPRYGPTAEVDLALTPELMAGAGRAAAAVGGTASAVFLAAWARVLGAHTGATDLAFCTPVSGRFLPASADSIGCYASMIALRLSPAAAPRVLLRQAAEQLREAMSAPLLSIDLQLPRPLDTSGRHPLLQAYFVLEEVPPSRVDIADGLHGEQIRVAPQTWIPEVHLELRPHPDLGGLIRYRTDVLSAADAERLAAQVPTEAAVLSGLPG